MDAHTDVHRRLEQVFNLIELLRRENLSQRQRLKACDDAFDATTEISAACMVQLEPVKEFWPQLDLTPRMRELAQLLYANFGKTLSRGDIMASLWSTSDPEPKIVDVYICKLRKKLIGSPYGILTKFNTGVSMVEASDPRLWAKRAHPLAQEGAFIPHLHHTRWHGVPVSEDHSRIINLLDDAAGSIVTLDKLYGLFPSKTGEQVRTKIAAVRHKIVPTGYFIVNEPGIGYSLLKRALAA